MKQFCKLRGNFYLGNTLGISFFNTKRIEVKMGNDVIEKTVRKFDGLIFLM